MPRSILLQPQARSSLEAPPRTGAYRRRPWPPCRRRRLWSPDDAAGASLRTTSVRPYPPVRQGASEGRHVELPFWLLPCTLRTATVRRIQRDSWSRSRFGSTKLTCCMRWKKYDRVEFVCGARQLESRRVIVVGLFHCSTSIFDVTSVPSKKVA